MVAIDNLVHETTSGTGAGNLTLVAVNGKQTFDTAFGHGATTNVFYYFISSRDAAEYEFGKGHMSDATTLVRDTVLGGTNGTSAVTFSAGTKDVCNDIPAAVYRARLIGNTTYYVRTPPVALTSISNASPAVFTKTAHGLSVGDPVVLTTTGTLPTGLTAGQVYYVIAAGFTANAFEVSATLGGSAINTSSAGSGTHSFSTGNDANNGLAATRASAWLSPEYALLWVRDNVDLAGYDLTVQVADGLYIINSSGVRLTGQTGAGNVFITGDGTSANVVFDGRTNNPTATISSENAGTNLTIQGLTVHSGTTSAASVMAIYKGSLKFQNITFGAATTYHTYINRGGYMEQTGTVFLDGGGVTFFAFNGATHNAIFYNVSQTISITQDLTYTYFAYSSSVSNVTYTGTPSILTNAHTMTGQRYQADENAVIQAVGLGTTFFPGSIAGGTASGGQYIP